MVGAKAASLPDGIFGEAGLDSIRIIAGVTVITVAALELLDCLDIFKHLQSAFHLGLTYRRSSQSSKRLILLPGLNLKRGRPDISY